MILWRHGTQPLGRPNMTDVVVAAPEKLSRGQKITVWVTVLIFIFTVLANILVREWYSSDLRYSIGENYFLDDRVAFSCVIKNMGHATAKNVRVYAVFDYPLLGYQVGGNVPAKTTDGGIGQKRLDLEVDRLVADSSFTVFYSLKQAQTQPVVEKIESDEGLARTGEPGLWNVLLAIPLLIIVMILGAFSARLSNRYQKELAARRKPGI